MWMEPLELPRTASSFPQSFVLRVGMKESVVLVHFTMEDREECYTDGPCSVMSLLDNCVRFPYSQKDLSQEWHLLVLELGGRIGYLQLGVPWR